MKAFVKTPAKTTRETAGSSGRYSRDRPVSSWCEHHRWSALTSLCRLGSRPFETLLTLLVMGLALALPLVFCLLMNNVQKLSDRLGHHPVINVFLQPDQSASVVRQLADKVRAYNEVAMVHVKTPRQGMTELAQMKGFSMMLHAFHENPLPYVLQVQPKRGPGGQTIAGRLAASLRALPGVDGVQDNARWRQRLDAWLGVGQRVVTLLTVGLVLAALLVMGHTVRLDIVSRTGEISVLLLLGAHPAFVHRPYLYAGTWYGLFSGVLAVLLVLLVQWMLNAPVARLNQVYGGLPVSGLPARLLLGVPLIAAVLGCLGARLVSAWQVHRVAK